MKILLITSNLEGGGAQRAMLNIASGLTGRGHRVRLLVLEHKVDHAAGAVEFESLLPAGHKLPGGWLGKWMLALRLRRWFREVTKNGEFQLIISTLPFTDEVVWRAGLPQVWYRIANTLSAEIESLSTPAKARRRKARYRCVYEGQRIIAVSAGVASDLRDKLHLQRTRIETVNNPFDFQRIRALAKTSDPAVPSEPYVLHVGRFAPQKRHDVLLDAFAAAQLPHQLVLLAEPSEGLSALIASRDLQSRVTVAGFRKNPYPWYAGASALMLTSDYEGMPNVLVEALACGTPVVSTDCPSGPREVLTGPMRRFLAPCGDIGGLAARLRDVVEHPPAIDPALLAPFECGKVLAAIEALVEKG